MSTIDDNSGIVTRQPKTVEMMLNMTDYDFTREGESSDDSYNLIGLRFLKHLDQDFTSSPRKIVRGVWRGDNLELVARRKTEGNLVHWTLTYLPQNKIVMLCKAKMNYKFSLPDTGINHGCKLRGGWGWAGEGYGFINIFPTTATTSYTTTAALSNSKPKHVDLMEAVFWSESRFYHVSGDGCKKDIETCTNDDCGVRIWSLMIDTWHVRSQKDDFFHTEQLIREDQDQTLFLSLVAYHSGDHKIIIHRDRQTVKWGGNAISKHTFVASLSQANLRFDDKPQIDHQQLRKHLKIVRAKEISPA